MWGNSKSMTARAGDTRLPEAEIVAGDVFALFCRLAKSKTCRSGSDRDGELGARRSRGTLDVGRGSLLQVDCGLVRLRHQSIELTPLCWNEFWTAMRA